MAAGLIFQEKSSAAGGFVSKRRSSTCRIEGLEGNRCVSGRYGRYAPGYQDSKRHTIVDLLMEGELLREVEMCLWSCVGSGLRKNRA